MFTSDFYHFSASDVDYLERTAFALKPKKRDLLHLHGFIVLAQKKRIEKRTARQSWRKHRSLLIWALFVDVCEDAMYHSRLFEEGEKLYIVKSIT